MGSVLLLLLASSFELSVAELDLRISKVSIDILRTCKTVAMEFNSCTESLLAL